MDSQLQVHAWDPIDVAQHHSTVHAWDSIGVAQEPERRFRPPRPPGPARPERGEGRTNVAQPVQAAWAVLDRFLTALEGRALCETRVL